MARMVRCIATFHCPEGLVTEGQILTASDPRTKGRLGVLFEDLDDDLNPVVVEVATAAPGEVRTLPKKQSARKAAATKEN